MSASAHYFCFSNVFVIITTCIRESALESKRMWNQHFFYIFSLQTMPLKVSWSEGISTVRKMHSTKLKTLVFYHNLSQNDSLADNGVHVCFVLFFAVSRYRHHDCFDVKDPDVIRWISVGNKVYCLKHQLKELSWHQIQLHRDRWMFQTFASPNWNPHFDSSWK